VTTSVSVSVRGVGVTLGRAPILHEVSVDVPAGSWLSIVGPNGAGKSTLLRAVAGLVASRGTIELGATDTRHLDRRAWARLVALVPQDPVVPPGMPVSSYVLLGRTPHIAPLGREGARDLEVAGRTLEELDLVALADRPLETLSGGERQRAMVGRALAQEAPVLLLDEPTTALDVGHQQDVLELVDRLRRERGCTVVASMHDLTLAGQYADHLLLLDHGRVVTTGLPEAVLTEENLARFYGARVRVIADGGSLVVVPVRPGVRVP
jgi:iron complex transport system ATP-binding protein